MVPKPGIAATAQSFGGGELRTTTLFSGLNPSRSTWPKQL